MKKIIFDTNALTNIYSYSLNTIENIVNALKKIEPEYQIIIVGTVWEEFSRHYHESRKRTCGKYPIAVFKKQYNEVKNKFLEKFANLRNMRLSEIFDTKIDDDFDKFSSDITSYLMTIDKDIEELENRTSGDGIDDSNDVLLDFVSKRKLRAYTIDEKLELAKKCEIRYEQSIKPGLSDYKKHDYPFQKYGDQFIWYQILENIQKDDDLIFVENETKNDWWNDSEKRIIATDLVKEFKENSSGTFEMMPFDDFYSKFLEKLIDDNDSKVEICKIRNDLNSYLNSLDMLNNLESELFNRISENELMDSLISKDLYGGTITNVYDFDKTKVDIIKDKFYCDYDSTFGQANINCEAIVFAKCLANVEYGNSGTPAVVSLILKFHLNVSSIYDLVINGKAISSSFNDENHKMFDVDFLNVENITYGYDEESEVGLYGYCANCSCPINDDNYGDGTLCHECLYQKD